MKFGQVSTLSGIEEEKPKREGLQDPKLDNTFDAKSFFGNVSHVTIAFRVAARKNRSESSKSVGSDYHPQGRFS